MKQLQLFCEPSGEHSFYALNQLWNSCSNSVFHGGAKDLGKVSIKLHEDGAVHPYIPIPDAVHVVEPSLKPELIFKLSSSLLLFFKNFW